MTEAGARSPDTHISVSPGLSDLLATLRGSLALTSYETGQLILIGRKPDGGLHFTHQTFDRAMGLAWRDNRLLLAARTQLWRFENLLEAGETGDGLYDAVLVPRIAFTVGDLDLHEVALGDGGAPIFVATLFNCIGAPDPKYSFRVLWKPPFISAVDRGDHCHLNGLAMDGGRPVLATAVGTSDILDGWRADRANSGILLALPNGETVAEHLAMPHSPRWTEQGIYFIESGRGMLVHVDPASGIKRDICFLPGFARGLSILGGIAVVTLSLPREIAIAELPLARELADRKAESFCGLAFIDLSNGKLVEWVRFEGRIAELFDVVWLPGMACPTALGVGTEEICRNIRIRD